MVASPSSGGRTQQIAVTKMDRPIIRLTLPVIFFALIMVSKATAFERQWEIIPQIGYRAGGSLEDLNTGDSLDIDEDFSYGIAIAVDFNERSQFEFFWSRQDTNLKGSKDSNPNIDFSIDYFHLASTYSWHYTEKYKAYVIASVGATHLDPDNSAYDDELYFSMGLGLGFKYYFTKYIGFVIEGRGFGTFTGGNTEIFCSSQTGCYIRTEQDVLIQLQGQIGLIFRF